MAAFAGPASISAVQQVTTSNISIVRYRLNWPFEATCTVPASTGNSHVIVIGEDISGNDANTGTTSGMA